MLSRVALRLLWVTGTALAFSALDRFSSYFQVEEGVAIVFPGTAVAVLACMAFGIWGALGVFIATIATPWPAIAGAPLVASGLINTMEGLLPYAVFRFRPRLNSDLRDMRSFGAFLLFGTIVNTGLSATLGNLVLVGEATGRSIFVWWVADFTAALLVATPVLAFGSELLDRLRGERPARPPRTLVNTLQITGIIILLGWGASASVRNYLVTHLERGRLAQQEAASRASRILNHLHTNVLTASRIEMRLSSRPAPALRTDLELARNRNRAYLHDLDLLLGEGSPYVRALHRQVAATAATWFDQTRAALDSGRSPPEATVANALGSRILALQSELEALNAIAWREYAEKRRRIMAVSLFTDLFVFLLLLFASLNLIFRMSRPLRAIHHAITRLPAGGHFEAKSLDSEFVELQTLARAIDDTGRELGQRERELRLQTERAVAASRHKSDFLAKMSHELRTPLNSIVGFSDLLIEQNEAMEPAKRKNFLENVSRSGKQLLHLINDLLDIAKIEAGKISFHYEDIDVRHVVQHSIASTIPIFRKKNQHVDLRLGDEPIIIHVDPGRLEQVLLNLLSNAHKFSHEGDRIVVSTSADDRRCTIAVEDHGIGIGSDDHARIFEEFEQVASGPIQIDGTGLGLALAKRFVEAQGGWIEVESRPGRGSTFRVSFPLRASGAWPRDPSTS